jgi:hypothetical protein
LLAANDTNAQHALENMYVPAAVGVAHILCRVELLPDLVFSTREFTDFRYRCEERNQLLQRFHDGMSLRNRGSGSMKELSLQLVSYILWILSAGEGSSALNRGVTSVEVLSKAERASFDNHVAILCSLGLTYIAAPESEDGYVATNLIKPLLLDPPIHKLCQFSDLLLNHGQIRLDIPLMVRLTCENECYV